MPMRRILVMLSYLTASGCTGINLGGITLDDAAPSAAPQPKPEGKRFAELATAAFARAKLTGAPEISPVRATHDSQWGDWVFCIRSGGAEPSLRYAVLIGHDAILEVRSSVLIDGCDQETYQPLAPAAKAVKARDHK
jgi:hypothetical protein